MIIKTIDELFDFLQINFEKPSTNLWILGFELINLVEN